ncbi:hypothetical protein FYJ91_06185 [Sphingomonas montanisoli]|uniref:Uncharacterized protein n=1 Tax=Sphingomonas montanisoli TaxID=2606412 RepID=A0A5D9C699_9SPHN|nr:hypothetical protein FYJ91_06185 [Sphingomonas montanisoli]
MQHNCFLDRIAKTAPGAASENTGTGLTDDRARLTDVIGELDSIVLTAFEEITRIKDGGAH